jgi:hypothetical protein
VGRWAGLEKIISCVMSLTRGWERSSQYGICPLVTIYIFLTQGAYFSTERNEKRSSSLSMNLLRESASFIQAEPLVLVVLVLVVFVDVVLLVELLLLQISTKKRQI